MIKKIKISNFKCFYGCFELEFSNGLNILVGNNEAGKSSILEAVHIVLSGIINGKYIKNELTQYLFNNQIVNEYISSLNTGNPQSLPTIMIELFFNDNDAYAIFMGDGNSEKDKHASGVIFKICFDERYQEEYESLVKNGNIKTLPIEYYEVTLTSFARKEITTKSLPKSAFIDSSSNRYQNGSDIYISKIIKDDLDPDEVVKISQAHRKMRDTFDDDPTIKSINLKLNKSAKISHKTVELSVELLSKNAWENSLMTYLDSVPFHYIGKGEQSVVKTKLALANKKTLNASIILLEEPENHLTYTKLSELIKDIKDDCTSKQIIISTHSSFVANKLGLENLILLNERKTLKLTDLKDTDTKKFFEKIAGYDTLRLILCKKAILVEGDSDELVVQKAYMNANGGKLPIEDRIDVISVGTSFLRFLEIAQKLKIPVAVVTDNDGDIDAVLTKYVDYVGGNKKTYIDICYDSEVDEGELIIGKTPYNYNTLEPKLLKHNSLTILNKIFGTSYKDEDELRKYMQHNKVECALKIFETKEDIIFPKYILEAIRNEELKE